MVGKWSKRVGENLNLSASAFSMKYCFQWTERLVKMFSLSRANFVCFRNLVSKSLIQQTIEEASSYITISSSFEVYRQSVFKVPAPTLPLSLTLNLSHKK